MVCSNQTAAESGELCQTGLPSSAIGQFLSQESSKKGLFVREVVPKMLGSYNPRNQVTIQHSILDIAMAKFVS